MAEIKRLQAAPAPNLPLAPTEYNSTHYEVLNNALRLYFNQLTQNSAALFNNLGGKFLNFPYISAYDVDPQFTTDNTPTALIWTNGDVNGFVLGSSTEATVLQSGIYKITYSLQFANIDNAVHDVTVWLRRYDAATATTTDVPASATVFSIPARKSAGNASYVCGYSEVVFELSTNDKVSLWWATSKAAIPVIPLTNPLTFTTDGVYIFSEAAQTTPFAHPSVPSALGSITFVSAPQA